MNIFLKHSLFLSLHLFLWFPSLCLGQSGQTTRPIEECVLEDRFSLIEYGCNCYSGHLENGCSYSNSPHLRTISCIPPSTLESFPVSTVVNENISCIIISKAGFRSLTKDDLTNFPNLTGLYITNSRRLQTVSEDLFDNTRQLEYLTIFRTSISRLPRLTDLSSMIIINVTDNEIEEIQPGVLDGISALASFFAGGNSIKEIRGNVFTGHCQLQNLHLNNNPLTFIDKEALEDTRIDTLDLSNTHISKVPVADSLRNYLTTLILAGTKRLLDFDPFAPPRDAPYNQTFPFLSSVSFFYHAHCCRMRGHKYLQNPHAAAKRSLDSGIDNHQVENSGFVGSQSGLSKHVRQVRQASTSSEPMSMLSYRCVNLTSLECLNSSTENVMASDLTSVLSAEEYCNSSDVCYSCLSDICPQGSCNSTDTGSGFVGGSGSVGESGSVGGSDEILCISVTPQPAPTSTVTSTFTTVLNRTVCPTPTTTPPGPSCENPTQEWVCSNHEAYCSCMDSFMKQQNCMLCLEEDGEFCEEGGQGCENIPIVCECPRRKKRSVAEEFIDSIQPHSIEKRNPSSSMVDENCTVSEIDALCVTTVTLPIATPTMTPPIATPTMTPPDNSVAMETTMNDFNDSVWFFPNESNPDLRCRELEMNESVTMATTIVTTETTMTPSDDSNRAKCPDGSYVPFEIAIISVDDTVCTPEEDNLNPCDDLLEDNHALRVIIWIVIFLALVGNCLVISVFLGYSVIIRRTRLDLFVSHFFYFNLAVADSLMGVYLLTIAIEDLVTLNNFSAHDVRWRIGHGCGFAGFCAILSTMVSVYVLVVISVERAYTIVRVMHRKKLTKVAAMIIMAIGWIFGAIVAMLPLVGVSDYGFVAICLPFDVTRPIDQGYVAFLLIITGVGFIIVAACYIIIFYQVFCSRKQHVYRHGSKAWKQEVKAAFRMSLLVITNFVCWLPIASVGLGTAFGHNLNVDLTFAKWAMVLIFPINACLNPFLYSFTTKIFRENFIILLSKCGFFKDKVRRMRNARIGITPSITSNRESSSQVPPTRRKGTIIERLRLLSLSAQGSSTDLSERRGSGSIVDVDEKYLNQKRRSSEFSSASSDLLIAAGASRRSSTFSGNSLEENMTFANPGYRANSPINRTATEVTVILEPSKLAQSPRPKVSGSSLGVVIEEGEMSSSSEDALKLNSSYRDEEDGPSSPSDGVVLRQNGGVGYPQHQIDAGKRRGVNDSKRDSGNSSDSPSLNGEDVSELESELSNNSGSRSTNPSQQIESKTTSSDVSAPVTVERSLIEEVEQELAADKQREVQTEEIKFD